MGYPLHMTLRSSRRQRREFLAEISKATDGIIVPMTRRHLCMALLVAMAAGGCSKTEAPGTTPPAMGTITLAVDAREVDRKIFHARETIPANPGRLTLVYPKWIPGEHGPTGPITDLVGLRFLIGGKPIAWRRDAVDMYAFHVDVPAGAQSVDVSLDFLSAASTSGFSSAASVTPHLAIVTWNQLLLYPLGLKTDDVKIQASLTLPAGWNHGTALRTTAKRGDELTFAPVSLTTLVDSPVLAGQFFLPIALDPSGRPVELDLAADSAPSLQISAELTGKLRRLVGEADALFGARHFDDYHFLLTLSDYVAHFGLEHHQSNDSRVYEKAVLDQSPSLGVLAHEYVHSWNGKYRRPAGLVTPDFQEPMQGELLWIYEGLTQYLGYLLAVRSGLWTDQYYKERLALVSAYLDNLPGREWRPLVDTTVAAQLLYPAPNAWAAYRRGTDFYDEGWLIWLDVDTLIRSMTGGQKSLDNFCQTFHGGASGSPAVRPYTLDDVVTALNDVAPYDWKTFLTTRVGRTGPRAPLDGVTRGGWRLVYNDTRNEHALFLEKGELKRTDAGYSIGVRVHDDGTVIDAVPGTPGFAAGLVPGIKIIAVGGKKWSPDVLRAALLASEKGRTAVALRVENQTATADLTVDYHDGLREPHLERSSGADILKDIMAPHARPVAAVR